MHCRRGGGLGLVRLSLFGRGGPQAFPGGAVMGLVSHGMVTEDTTGYLFVLNISKLYYISRRRLS